MTKSLGLYIHVPFCKNKCTYCSFFSSAFSDDVKRDYILRTSKELKQWGTLTDCPIDTIYFGGGTPSLLKPFELESILTDIKENFNVTDDAEITLEINPGDEIEPLLDVAISHGVNRVSLGMQSANPEELKLLGRRHDFDAVKSTVETLYCKGIKNISVDLIVGIPDSNIEKLDRSIDAALSLNVTHISVYILKLEENTPLFLNKDKLNLLSEDEICEQYLHVCGRLKEQGFEHYEISNFAKGKNFSRHNNRYWLGKEYIGIGPSAYSYFEGKRFHYPADIKSYLGSAEIVYDEDGGGLEEFIMLRLRLNTGIDLTELREKFGITDFSPLLKLVKRLEKAELCEYKDNHIRLTEKGMLVSNSIIVEILGVIDENL